MKWKLLRSIFRLKPKIKHALDENDKVTEKITKLINENPHYIALKSYIASIFIFKKETGDREEILNLDKIEKFRRELDIENLRKYRVIIVQGGFIKALSESYSYAFLLRNIGHNSGFKYSKVYPSQIGKFPIVEIRGTENIMIPITKNKIQYLKLLTKEIISEVMTKNKKRGLLLIKNLEKLKY